MLIKIVEGNFNLNDVTIMVHNWWNQLSHNYPDVELDTFVIMPRHLHGIIIIQNNNHGTGNVAGAKSSRPYDSVPPSTGE